MTDDLQNFLNWFLHKPIGMLTPPPGGIICLEGVVAVNLFRGGQYQVELIIMKPGSASWPGEHRHPDVDTFEVFLSGYNEVTKNGVICNQPELVIPIEVEPGFIKPCLCVRLLPTDFHGAHGSPEGGALLSVQHWLNDVPPTSVGRNWLGQPSTGGHSELLQTEGTKYITVQ